MRNLSTLLIILTFCGCIKNPANKTIILNCYQKNKISKSTNLALRVDKKNDTLIYFYRSILDSVDTYAFVFSRNKIYDSIIRIYENDCPLIEKKCITVENNEYEILKYYFDEKNLVDEEISYFINWKYGLLVCYDDAWKNLSYTISYDKISKQLIDSIKNDKTGFYVNELPFTQ